jgi:hypothetical protein
MATFIVYDSRLEINNYCLLGDGRFDVDHIGGHPKRTVNLWIVSR